MSDLVLFIYRDEMYNPKPENRGLAELILAKQRNGPTANIAVGYVSENTNFLDLGKNE